MTIEIAKKLSEQGIKSNGDRKKIRGALTYHAPSNAFLAGLEAVGKMGSGERRKTGLV